MGNLGPFWLCGRKTKAPVTSISETSETTKASELSEPVIDKPEISKPLKPIECISNILKGSKSNNNEILSTRIWREEHFRKWATDHGEDPDKFMIIIEKDVNLSREYRDRMMADAEVIEFAREIR